MTPKESGNILSFSSGILKPTVWFFGFALLLIVAHSLHAAGVTIITHGWQFGPFGPVGGTEAPGWAYSMADAILDRADGIATRRTNYGSIYIHEPETGDWRAPTTEEMSERLNNRVNSGSTNEEIVLVYNWAQESDRLENGWLEAAADTLFARLVNGPINLGIGNVLASGKTIHFIGHSRGAVLNALTVSRIGFWFPEVTVDHVTTLDPHPN